jgi:Transposase DDE domain
MQDLASIGAVPINKLISRLPGAVDIEAMARAAGAFLRARKIKTAGQLLHLALAYAVGELSLRDTAAWSTMSGTALSDVAVLKRLRPPGVAAWLREVIAAILTQRQRPAEPSGWRVRVIDATVVSSPGSAADYRLHASYDLASQQLVGITLSGTSDSESLRHFAIGPGEIAVADRGYLKARDLSAVREAGGHFVVRAGWNSARWHHADGTPFDLFAWLGELGYGAHAEIPVTIWPERTARDAFPVRLIARRMAKSEAETSRRRARRSASKGQRRVTAQTLKGAEFILLVTSLDAEAFPAADSLALYRRRWQVELAFKRLKSLLGLDQMPAKDPDLARTWIYAKLLAHLLAEDLTREILDAPPCARRHQAGPFLLDLAHPENALQSPRPRNPRHHLPRELDRQHPSTPPTVGRANKTPTNPGTNNPALHKLAPMGTSPAPTALQNRVSRPGASSRQRRCAPGGAPRRTIRRASP